MESVDSDNSNVVLSGFTVDIASPADSEQLLNEAKEAAAMDAEAAKIKAEQLAEEARIAEEAKKAAEAKAQGRRKR